MKRIGLICGNINDGIAYQRLHIPFRNLKDKYEIKCFNIDEIKNSDLFYLDTIVFCHAWSPDIMTLIERARTWYGCKVVVDIDDLLHDIPSDHPDYSYVAPYQRVAHILQAANEVVVSTEYLKSAYGHLNKNITVIENCIDERIKNVYRPENKPYKNSFVAGWTGGKSHASDQFEMIAGLTEFLNETPDARAYFHLQCPQVMLNRFGAQVHFEPTPCYFLDYPGVAAAYPFDVCTVPLINHPFNHAKSDLRLLDMAPNDIVLIASPRSDFIQHQEKRIMLYADDNDSNYKTWAEQLQWAYSHPKELKLMAARAREYVYTERNSKVSSNKWNDILQKLG